MILIYVTCNSKVEAEKIGKSLLKKRLCACINILPEIDAQYFWPPKVDKIAMGKETVLLVKTVEEKYEEVESEITKLHSDDTPCIFAVPISHVSQKYSRWLQGEIKS